jgi:hypothetical protein
MLEFEKSKLAELLARREVLTRSQSDKESGRRGLTAAELDGEIEDARERVAARQRLADLANRGNRNAG